MASEPSRLGFGVKIVFTMPAWSLHPIVASEVLPSGHGTTAVFHRVILPDPAQFIAPPTLNRPSGSMAPFLMATATVTRLRRSPRALVSLGLVGLSRKSTR